MRLQTDVKREAADQALARICHANNCPVGVTTQKEKLRKKFVGVPSDTLNFFIYAAQEVRQCLAALGFTSLGELVWREMSRA